jgi:hypothetical protein
MRPDVWQTTLVGNGQPEVLPLLLWAVWRMGGPCQWLALQLVFVAGAWIATSCLWFWRRQERDLGAIRGALAVWTAAAGFIWSMAPFMVETIPGTLNMLRASSSPVRFGLCFLNLALLCSVILLQDLALGLQHIIKVVSSARGPNRRLQGIGSGLARLMATAPTIILAGAVIYQLVECFRRATDKVDTLLVAASLLLAGLLIVSCLKTWPVTRPLFGGLLAVAIVAGIVWLGQRWHAGFVGHYDRMFGGYPYSRLSEMNPGDTRVCVLGFRYYPFFGSRRQFRVSRPLWVPTYASLLEYLRDRDVTLIFADKSEASNVRRRYAIARDCLEQHPDVFEMIQDGPTYFVFRVNRGMLAKLSASK